MIKNAILKIIEDIGANEDNSRCDEPPKRIVFAVILYIRYIGCKAKAVWSRLTPFARDVCKASKLPSSQ
jgi:hypothetical protein